MTIDPSELEPRRERGSQQGTDEGPAPTRDRRKDRLLRIKAVRARTGLSTTSIYRREAEGRFPKKRKLGPRSVAWYETDIDDFVADPLNYRS